MPRYLIQQYQTAQGEKPFLKWVMGLDAAVTARVLARVERLQLGNLGQNRHLGGGLCEAKMDFGPGYRVYFGLHGNALILLLCGGDKSTQNRDIQKAKKYWQDYLGGSHEG